MSMLLNICLFVILTTSWVLSDLQNDYEEISRRQDATMIQTYFLLKDPLSLRLLWDQIWARTLYVAVLGKQKALEVADVSQVLEVKKEWTVIEKQLEKNQFELKTMVDFLRSEGLDKTPAQWAKIINHVIHIFESFKSAAVEGNLNNMRKIAINHLRYLRQIKSDDI